MPRGAPLNIKATRASALINPKRNKTRVVFNKDTIGVVKEGVVKDGAAAEEEEEVNSCIN